jgi:flagellar hook-associated protein 2
MALSSPGVGSGLDINGIVAQLVAIEKQPLQMLQLKATTIQTKLSSVGQIQGQVSSLSDAVTKLANASAWTGLTVTSSNTSAVTASVSASAAATSFSVEVQTLATARSAVTQTAVSSAATFGTGGTLSIQIGSRAFLPLVSGARTAGPFAATAGTLPVNVTVDATDTVTTIAGKINAANAGVTATVVRDGSGDRLLLRSNTTGFDADFQVATTGDPSLGGFAFDDAGGPTEMSSSVTQKPKDAQATINGVAVTSATNTLTDTVPGLTLQLTQVTTAPLTVKIANDVATIRANIQGFLNSYNALNKTLTDATKFDATSKAAGPLQGDSTIVGLQNALRALVGSSSSGSTFQRLSEIGVQMQKDGSLTVNTTKFDSAIADVSNLQKLFAADNGDPQTNGFALKMKSFTVGLLAVNGQISAKTSALQTAGASNSKDQDRINQRAALAEVRLKKQYSTLDANLGSLQALNSYVSQQVTAWNKSSG